MKESVMQRIIPTFGVREKTLTEELTGAVSAFDEARNRLRNILGRCLKQKQEAEKDREIARLAYDEAVAYSVSKENEAIAIETRTTKSLEAFDALLGE